MKIIYRKSFVKNFKKKDSFIKQRFLDRQRIFMVNKFDMILNNHTLSGELSGCRSLNITGDVRAIYEEISENHFEFISLGTHSELYE